MITAMAIMMKSWFPSGPVPWVMPFNNAGCCFSHTGQALAEPTLRPKRTVKMDILIVLFFIVFYLPVAFTFSISFCTCCRVTFFPLLPQLVRSWFIIAVTSSAFNLLFVPTAGITPNPSFSRPL